MNHSPKNTLRLSLILCVLFSAFGCARRPAATPPKPPLPPEFVREQKVIMEQIEKTKIRLRAGGKITNSTEAFMLYFGGALAQDTELLALLKKSGADIEARMPRMNTSALQTAVLAAEPKAASLLIEFGADVNTTDHEGKTPLYDAVASDNEELTRLLLEHGAKPNVYETVFWATPLLNAALGGKIEIVRLLLEHGADPNLPSRRGGARPLHFAVIRGHAEVVRLLLEHGADPNLKTEAGTTPLASAQNNHYPEIIAILKKHGAREN